MAASLTRRRWRPFATLGILAIALLAGFIGYRYYKEVTMPPPFVYLIPADYFGPVGPPRFS